MMQNTKLVLVIVALVLLVGAAAFMGGRLLNQKAAANPAAPFEGDFRSILTPAPELPTSLPEVTGPFIERQDNMIIVEVKSFGTSGLVSVSPSATRGQRGPVVEVVVTKETLVYRETTQPSEPLSVENKTIQQTVEQATLDDLDSQSMLMVWGRKSGDRIIADVLMYSDVVAVKGAIFEDCEICP